MERLGYLVEDRYRSANREDWQKMAYPARKVGRD